MSATVTFAQGLECQPPQQMVDWLSGEFDERLVFFGYDQDRKRFGLLANMDTGSWTAVLERGTMLCIISAGTFAQLIAQGEDINYE